MAIKKNLPLDDYLGIGSLGRGATAGVPQGAFEKDGALGGGANRPTSEVGSASDYLGLEALGGAGANPVIPVSPVSPVAPVSSVISDDPVKSKRKYTYTDEETGDLIDVYEDDTEVIRRKGTVKLDAQKAADATAAATLAKKKSAFDILRRGMKENGLEALVDAAIDAIMNEETDAGRLLALRSSPAYKIRFSANDKRVKNGFAAIDEATYLGLEDSYQSILQNYGMPAKYYTRGELGVQQYLADAIAKNIDPTTFEERIVEGVKITNANKFVIDAAKEIYPTLNDGDFLDYVLNPENALVDIRRKVTAAEIGGAQLGAGLKVTASRAEELAKVTTGAKYQAKATDIAEATLRGGQLASIYGQGPYTQQMAEDVQLDLPGSVESLKKTKKTIGLERASFGGGTGITQGALARDRAGGY